MYKVLFYTGTFNIKNMFQFPVLEHPFIILFNCLGLLFFGSFLHFLYTNTNAFLWFKDCTRVIALVSQLFEDFYANDQI